jgi:hypothetical protein
VQWLKPNPLTRGGTARSTREQLVKLRLGMLALADELKNVARAWKLAGVSRSHFYDIKNAYTTCRKGRRGFSGFALETARGGGRAGQAPKKAFSPRGYQARIFRSSEQQFLERRKLWPRPSRSGSL